MSNFQAGCKKTLVRNTKQQLPKTTMLVEPVVVVQDKKPVQKKPADVVKKIDLGLPTANSSKTLIKKIRDVESLTNRRIKSVSDVDKESKLAVQEKITKQMNFHCDQAIYKDLIPICSKSSSQSALPSRDPLPQKDKEPLLQDFVRLRTLPEYDYKVGIQNKQQNMIREFDGFKMYKLMQKW